MPRYLGVGLQRSSQIPQVSSGLDRFAKRGSQMLSLYYLHFPMVPMGVAQFNVQYSNIMAFMLLYGIK